MKFCQSAEITAHQNHAVFHETTHWGFSLMSVHIYQFWFISQK